MRPPRPHRSTGQAAQRAHLVRQVQARTRRREPHRLRGGLFVVAPLKMTSATPATGPQQRNKNHCCKGGPQQPCNSAPRNTRKSTATALQQRATVAQQPNSYPRNRRNSPLRGGETVAPLARSTLLRSRHSSAALRLRASLARWALTTIEDRSRPMTWREAEAGIHLVVGMQMITAKLKPSLGRGRGSPPP